MSRQPVDVSEPTGATARRSGRDVARWAAWMLAACLTFSVLTLAGSVADAAAPAKEKEKPKKDEGNGGDGDGGIGPDGQRPPGQDGGGQPAPAPENE